jgi:hypothetical protein
LQSTVLVEIGRFVLPGDPLASGGTPVATASTSRQISFLGRVLWEGVRQASACTEEPILCVAQGQDLIFVALHGGRLVVSWRFRLLATVDSPLIFGIPPMIVSHLLTARTQKDEDVNVVVKGGEVSLTACDEKGSYELRWRFDLRTFPAPAEMSRMLVLPSTLVRLNYLQLSDSVHQAVAKLVDMESQRRIHRTKLAILVGLSRGVLTVDGQEIGAQDVGYYYFDPRLIIRALEYVHAEQIEMGLTGLDSQRAFLSIVDRQPDCIVHCALLSIGRDTQRLFPPPPGRD